MYVQAGFILGFDHDPDNIADLIVDYVDTTGITIAMTGLLLALPHTQLERQLISEGRMMGTAGIDQFGLPNFITQAHPTDVMRQFHQVMRGCFGTEALNRRLHQQQSIFSSAHPMKRHLACTELAFYAAHLQLYSERVLQDIATLTSRAKFQQYIVVHEDYWTPHMVEEGHRQHREARSTYSSNASLDSLVGHRPSAVTVGMNGTGSKVRSEPPMGERSDGVVGLGNDSGEG